MPLLKSGYISYQHDRHIYVNDVTWVRFELQTSRSGDELATTTPSPLVNFFLSIAQEPSIPQILFYLISSNNTIEAKINKSNIPFPLSHHKELLPSNKLHVYSISFKSTYH